MLVNLYLLKKINSHLQYYKNKLDLLIVRIFDENAVLK